MKKYQLGEFEEVVMLTVVILHDNAYGVSVKKGIESRLRQCGRPTDRTVRFCNICSIRRMHSSGLVSIVLTPRLLSLYGA